MFKDKLNEECAIFGGYCKDSNIAPIIREGLVLLQHRGQESAGICTGENEQFLYKANGLVKNVFKEIPNSLQGCFGIGHLRYSTQGKNLEVNAQPFLVDNISIAHNGNIKEASVIKQNLESMGVRFESLSDTEVILKKIVHECSEYSFDTIAQVLNEYFSLGAYCLVVFSDKKIFAYRDSFGYRPLFFCEAQEGYFVASEDVAFEKLNPICIKEIKAGWGVEINEFGYEIKQFAQDIDEKKCVFEPIYFSSSKSNVFGQNVYETRVSLGKLLAKKDRVKADIVVPIPSSGFAAAVGYSLESNIPLKKGLFLSEDSERSFILPTQKLRAQRVKDKLFPQRKIIQDKKIILIDDSVVRGTTCKEVVKLLKNAGAKEVHLRLSSPKIINTCFWGVDIPTKEELFASFYDTEEQMADFLGVNSVKFLNFEDLKDFFGQNGWCYNCFMQESGNNSCLEEKQTCNQLMKTQALV